jgi:dimethyladenosine transferase
MDNKLTDIAYLRGLLAKYKFKFSKEYGQNFIVSPDVCPRMVEEAGIDESYGVLEIGPGVGVLTQELSLAAGKVVAIEIDKHLKPLLKETLAGCENVEVIFADVLKLDLHELLKEHFAEYEKVAVCANLPYYITSQVLMKLLEEKLPVESITVMVQKEAARRLLAKQQTREVGAITMAVHYYADGEILFDVQPGSFMPAPKVVSSVMKLTPRKQAEYTPNNEKDLFAVIKAAFSQRRKTAANAISAGLKLPKEQVQNALEEARIPVMARPEQISLSQFVELSNIVFM